VNQTTKDDDDQILALHLSPFIRFEVRGGCCGLHVSTTTDDTWVLRQTPKTCDL
jgi:hypothetical protein